MKSLLAIVPVLVVALFVFLFGVRLEQPQGNGEVIVSPLLGKALPTPQQPNWLIAPTFEAASEASQSAEGSLEISEPWMTFEPNAPVFAAAQKASSDQPFILSVWATWCPSCVREHGVLTQIAAQGVVLMGLDYKDDAEAARAFLAEHGNPFMGVLSDTNGNYGFDLGVYGAPEHFLVGSNGVLLDKHVGEITLALWQRWQRRFFQDKAGQ